jgi:AAA ATPase domain/Domain of unknown function (DUF4062)
MASPSNPTVFVSSPFRGMHRERDLLNRVVMPQVQEHLRQTGHLASLQWVDLRWGVTEGDVSAVVRVCLDEVERSSPFFLCLLGATYGTVLSRPAFGSVAERFGLQIRRESISVTELEIELALKLLAQGKCRPLFLVRENDPSNPDDAAIAALKRRVAAVPGAETAPYTRGELSNDSTEPVTRIASTIASWLTRDLPPPRVDAEADDVASYAALVHFLVEDTAQCFVGRSALVAHLANTLSQPSARPRLLGLRGDAGEGKTCVAAMVFEALRGQDVVVLSNFTAIIPEGRYVDRMLSRFCHELGDALGRPRIASAAASRLDLAQLFADLVSGAAPRPVVIVLDTLEDFESTPEGRMLTWLPTPLPGNLRVLVTCRDARDLARVWDETIEIVEMPPFSASDATSLVRALCVLRRRSLSGGAVAAIMAKGVSTAGAWNISPLWITLLIEELVLLDAEDFARADGLGGQGSTKIEQLLLDTIREAPSTLAGIYDFIFERLEARAGRRRVTAVAGPLSVARVGWRPSDLKAFAGGDRLELSDAALAQIRYGLRAQISTTGPAQTWRWRHNTARDAAEARYLAVDGSIDDLHARI